MGKLCSYIYIWQSVYGFSSTHVQMWELDHKEGCVQKNWCPLTAVLEKILERSPLDCKEFKRVNPKGNQPWILIGKIEVEAPTLWPPNAKRWVIGKDPDAGKDWRQEKTGTAEEEMAGCHHRLNGHESEQTPGDSGGQRSLTCCYPWGHKGSDTR